MSRAQEEASVVTAFPRNYRRSLAPEVTGRDPERTSIAPENIADEGRARYHETQTELAHVNRVEMLGHLSASIAHELNQPISAVVINAQTALRLLGAQPSNMQVVQRLLDLIVKDGLRAGDIVERTRALIKKAPPRKECLEINAAILEALEVTHHELVANGVSVQLKLAKGLPLVWGDRVQLQQVMLNLIINAIEAMNSRGAGTRDLSIRTAQTPSSDLLVEVQDNGAGIDQGNLERIFDAFFSTKVGGLGMGLCISRAIIQAHDGRLWAAVDAPNGTVLQFTLPTGTSSTP